MPLPKVPRFLLEAISAAKGYNWAISDQQLAHIKSRHAIQGFILLREIQQGLPIKKHLWKTSAIIMEAVGTIQMEATQPFK